MNSAEKLAAWIETALNEGVEEFRWIFLGGSCNDDSLLDKFVGRMAEVFAPELRVQRESAEQEAVRANVLGLALVGALGFRSAVKAVDWKRVHRGQATIPGEVARLLRIQPELAETVAEHHGDVERGLTALQIASMLRSGGLGDWPELPESPPTRMQAAMSWLKGFAPVRAMRHALNSK